MVRAHPNQHPEKLAPKPKVERQLGVLLREPLPLDCSFEPGFAEESAIQDTVDESRLAITRRGAPRLGRNRGIRACTARFRASLVIGMRKTDGAIRLIVIEELSHGTPSAVPRIIETR